MKRATRNLVEQSLRVRSVAATVALFACALTESVTYAQVDSVRRRMDKRGKPRTTRTPRRRQSESGAPSMSHDLAARRAAQRACDALLAAQLRAGQHLIPFADACALGSALGMPPGSVRAANGDPTVIQHASVSGGML